MADVKQITFSHREVAEALVKDQGIHEGLWGIYVEFGIQGANISTDPESKNLLPAAVVPVLKLGIQRFGEENQLTVDAAQVNPQKEKQGRARRKQASSKS